MGFKAKTTKYRICALGFAAYLHSAGSRLVFWWYLFVFCWCSISVLVIRIMVVFCWYSISMLFVFYKLISVLLGLDWHTADILLVFDWYPDGILLMPIHSAGILLSLCLRFPGTRLAWHAVGSVFCFFRNWSNQNAVPELAMFPYRYFAVFRLLNCCFHLVRHVLAGCVAIYSGISFFACSH